MVFTLPVVSWVTFNITDVAGRRAATVDWQAMAIGLLGDLTGVGGYKAYSQGGRFRMVGFSVCWLGGRALGLWGHLSLGEGLWKILEDRLVVFSESIGF